MHKELREKKLCGLCSSFARFVVKKACQGISSICHLKFGFDLTFGF